jgi:hypothetical protein
VPGESGAAVYADGSLSPGGCAWRVQGALCADRCLSHMRILRDEKPVKSRGPFSFRIGTKFRKTMNVFKQIRKRDCLKKYILYYDQHKPLFVP